MGRPNQSHPITATLVDVYGQPTDPDEGTPIVWTVFDQDLNVLEETTQTDETWERLGTGQFRYYFVPPLGIYRFFVRLQATLDGKPQAAWGTEPVGLPS